MLYNKLLESIYFLAGKVSKYDAWIKYQNLLKNQWLSQEELEKIQWQKLKAILDYSYKNIPFYKKKFDSVGIKPQDILGPKDVLSIPITTREELTTINQPLNPKLSSKDLEWVTTSGTIGKPLIWPFDLSTYNTKYALFLRGYSFTDWKLGDKVCSLWWPGHSGYTNNEPFIGIKNIIYRFAHRRTLFPPITKNSTDIIEETAKMIYQKLKNHPPNIFETSTDNLLFLSDFMEEKSLSPLKIQNVIAIGLLTQGQEEKIKKWFSDIVMNRYCPHEMAGIAHECSYHTGLHLSIDSYYLECLKDNKPTPSKETGEFIITDLDNFTQPLIRYKIGDSGSLSSKKCPCGRSLPLINYLEGRSEDFIVNEPRPFCSNETLHSKKERGEFKQKISPLFMIKFFEGEPEIKFFQLNQTDKLNFKLLVVKKKDAFIEVKGLEKKLRNILGESAKVEINFVQSILSEPSGKFGWVKHAASYKLHA